MIYFSRGKKKGMSKTRNENLCCLTKQFNYVLSKTICKSPVFIFSGEVNGGGFFFNFCGEVNYLLHAFRPLWTCPLAHCHCMLIMLENGQVRIIRFQRGRPYPVRFFSEDGQKCWFCCLYAFLGSK